ncbi:hypothetical protein ACVCNR_11200 [Aquamicrobium terrae]
MSNDPNRLSNEAAADPSEIYDHRCEHPNCLKWGSFGYSPNKNIKPKWYCGLHRGDGEALIGSMTRQ